MSDTPTHGPDAPESAEKKDKKSLEEQLKRKVYNKIANKKTYGIAKNISGNSEEFNRLEEYLKSDFNAINSVHNDIVNDFLFDKTFKEKFFKNVEQRDFEAEIQKIPGLNTGAIRQCIQKMILERNTARRAMWAFVEEKFGDEKSKDAKWKNAIESMTLDELENATKDVWVFKKICREKKYLEFKDMRRPSVDAKTEKLMKKFDEKFEKKRSAMSDEQREEIEKEMKLSQESGAPTERMIEIVINTIGDKDEDELIEIFKMIHPTMEWRDVYNIFLNNTARKNAFSILNFRAFYEDVYKMKLTETDDEILKRKDFVKFETQLHDLRQDITVADIEKILQKKDFADEIYKNYFKNDIQRSGIVKMIHKGIVDSVDEKGQEPVRHDIDQVKQSLQKTIKNNSALAEKLGDNPKKAIEDIAEDRKIIIKNKDGKMAVWNIVDIEEWDKDENNHPKITLQRQKLAETSGKYYWEEDNAFAITLDEFEKIFIEKLESDLVENVQISKDMPETPENLDGLEELKTLKDLQKYVDLVDKDGAEKGFAIGTIFGILTANGPEYAEVYHIDEANKTLQFRLCNGKIFPSKDDIKEFGEMTWDRFAENISSSSTYFRRLGAMPTTEKFLENLAFLPDSAGGDLKKISGLSYKKGKIVKTEKDEKGKEHEVEVTAFKNNDTGTLITMEHHNDGTITAEMTVFASPKELWDTKKYTTDKQKAKQVRRVKHEKTFKRISKVQFLQMLQRRKAFVPVSQDEGKDFIAEYAEKHDINISDSSGKTGAVFTIGHLIHMFKNGKQYIEDYFKSIDEEKAAYAFMKMPWDLGRTGIDKMSNLIEGTFNLWKKKYKAVKMRKHIAENVLNWKPKPHEVFAGLMVVYEMWGTLYPDSYLQEIQGTKYVWFEKVCQALGLNPRDQLSICYDKEVKNREGAKDHIPEEELIKRLFKLQQWKNDMVQAIGGGAKIWKMADAGKKAQIEKWSKEVKEESAEAGGRANYVIAKFESNEFEISLWALPELIGASSSAEYMGVMFSYVMGGAPNYVHYSINKEFKNIAYGGMAYHAFCFTGNKKEADIYKSVVNTVVAHCSKKNPQMKEDYEKILKKMPWDPFAHVDQGGDEGGRYKDLYAFWQKYHKQLQPILQGVDPYLQTSLQNGMLDPEEAKNASDYLKTLGDYTDYMVSEKGGLKGASWRHVLTAQGTLDVGNSPYYQMSRDNPGYRSVGYWLSAMSIDGVTGALSGDDRETILYPKIMKLFDAVRDGESFRANPSYQKKQFEILYTEVLSKIWGKLKQVPDMNKERYDSNLKGWGDGYKYLHTLRKVYCFDVSWENMMLFTNSDKNSDEKMRFQQELDRAYHTFIVSWKKTSSVGVMWAIQEGVNSTLSWYNDMKMTFGEKKSANDENYKMAA